jgi:hypothetical protein
LLHVLILAGCYSLRARKAQPWPADFGQQTIKFKIVDLRFVQIQRHSFVCRLNDAWVWQVSAQFCQQIAQIGAGFIFRAIGPEQAGKRQARFWFPLSRKVEK